MKILAIETASSACSAALLIDDDIKVEFELAPRMHTQLILPMVTSLLATAGLKLQHIDAIAFSRGPGAFTGLRIAAGITQGLAFSADLPVIPISTLAAMAQSAYQQYDEHSIAVALDARIAEVYWGQYQLDSEQKMRLIDQELVCAPSQTPLLTRKSGAIGSGWAEYDIEMTSRHATQLSRIEPDINPSAEFIALLAVDDFKQQRWLDAAQAEPIYLRDNVALTIKERQQNA